MKVTPETLTDDQIIESLRLEGHPKVSLPDAWFSTADEPDGPRKQECRQRICDTINAHRRGTAP